MKIDDWLKRPARVARPPRLTDAELLTLAVAQVLLGVRSGVAVAEAGFCDRHTATAPHAPTNTYSNRSDNSSSRSTTPSKGQLDLELHDGRSIEDVSARIAQRLPALTAAIWHNRNTGQPVTR
ncbi:hypothetical protein [Micromonospora sp. NBC_00617]|uniref:hypothetical protein n=1 Tax=Micromonospora sp. NBC_00617 TaxID=2903587 RepID=UPI0030E1A8BA